MNDQDSIHLNRCLSEIKGKERGRMNEHFPTLEEIRSGYVPGPGDFGPFRGVTPNLRALEILNLLIGRCEGIVEMLEDYKDYRVPNVTDTSRSGMIAAFKDVRTWASTQRGGLK